MLHSKTTIEGVIYDLLPQYVEAEADTTPKVFVDKGRVPKKKPVFFMVFCQTPPRTPPPTVNQ